MKCLECEGTGLHRTDPWLPVNTTEPCKACGGSGEGTEDQFEAKLREAVAKIGMVYVVRDDENGRVKIGTALNPLSRLRDLQTGSSSPLRLIAMFPGGRKGEGEFQAIWPDRRLDGEWFDDGDEEISRIIKYTARTGGGILWPIR